MQRTINWDLLEGILDTRESAVDVYCEVRNQWGWSAENLVRHGEVAVVDEEGKGFWRTEHVSWVRDGAGGAV